MFSATKNGQKNQKQLRLSPLFRDCGAAWGVLHPFFDGSLIRSFSHEYLMGCIQSLTMPLAGSATSVAAGRLSYAFGLKAACISIDTACSSSLVGAHVGAREIVAGGATRALAAGVNLTLSPGKTAAFEVTGQIQADPRTFRVCVDLRRCLLSAQRKPTPKSTHLTLALTWMPHTFVGMLAPDGRCKTLDASGDGYVRAEACVTLLLEELSADDSAAAAIFKGSAINQVNAL